MIPIQLELAFDGTERFVFSNPRKTQLDVGRKWLNWLCRLREAFIRRPAPPPPPEQIWLEVRRGFPFLYHFFTEIEICRTQEDEDEKE